jgi:hypothetical protein
VFNPAQRGNSEQRMRRIEQHLLLLDVDVKRLWGRVPQTIDHLGIPGMNVSAIQNGGTSSGTSSSSEPVSSSGGPPEDGCPNCVTISVSGMTGDCEALNRTYNLTLSGICNEVTNATYSGAASFSFGGQTWGVNVNATYERSAQRWTASLNGTTPPAESNYTTASGSYASETGVAIDWAGDLEAETGCTMGTVSISSTWEDCPSSSSGGTSSGASSSGGSSSGASSSGASSSGASSSGASSGASSSGASSSGAPSSGGSSGASSGATSSGSYSGEASNGEVSSGENSYSDPECSSRVCSKFIWENGNWERILFQPGDCPIECATGCVEVPSQAGYPGLSAEVHCDGDIVYFEDA